MRLKLFVVALIGLVCGLNGGAQEIQLKQMLSISADEYGYAVDKDYEVYPVTIEYQGNNVQFTVYSDMTMEDVKKQFILNNVYDSWKKYPQSIRPHDLFMERELNQGVYLTQSLINKDDKWEVIVYSSEQKTNPNNPDDYDWETKTIVYNEDGEYLGELPLETGKDTNIKYAYINGEFYLVVANWDNNRNTIKLYSCSAIAAGSSVVMMEAGSRAYPNPLPSGHALTVELDSPADNATVVEIYDIYGRMVVSVPARKGETKIEVPARRLRNGNFVYVVKANGEKVDQGKIIAK